VDDKTYETFAALEALPAFVHGFTLRCPGVDVAAERGQVLDRLRGHLEAAVVALGYGWDDVVTGEQVHGSEVRAVDSAFKARHGVPGVDALITDRPDILLGVFVADCAAVYLVDRRRGVIGLAHSGKKGTELGIVPRTIAAMEACYGTDAADLCVQVSPCIRPPHYEVDFAREIRNQCEAAGVAAEEVHDEGTSTAGHLKRYYSYRMEKGKTGRMLALLGVRAGSRGESHDL
jgi:copper oxidase (laccase) domain-containing protein